VQGCADVFLKDTTTRRSVLADATSALLTVRSSSVHWLTVAGEVDGGNRGVDGGDVAVAVNNDFGCADGDGAGLAV
jgi:hypothetical protein